MINKILELIASIFAKKPSAKPLSSPTISTEAAFEQLEKLNTYSSIPEKQSSITGSQFIQNNLSLNGSIRETNILREFTNGNIPDFLRTFVPITIKNGTNTITYYVMPDYLSIGTNEDYCRMPMNPLTARTITDLYGCVLPTKKMVDDIYKNADIKLQAKPYGPPYNEEMESTTRFQWSNNAIQNQLAGKALGELVAGHKKDVVIGKQLLTNKKNVGIYGWFLNGTAIQGPNPNYSSHSSLYSDYSHGIRLISAQCIVNNNQTDIYSVLKDPKLCNLISSEGSFDATTIYKESK